MPETIPVILTRTELLLLTALLNNSHVILRDESVDDKAGVNDTAAQALWERLVHDYTDEFGSDPGDDARGLIAAGRKIGDVA